MKTRTRYGLLVGAGFLAGSVGLKALMSPAAKRVYVQGIAKGLQAKSCYEGIVEQAKAQVDDIVAEAHYINATELGKAADVCEAAAEPAAESEPSETGAAKKAKK